MQAEIRQAPIKSPVYRSRMHHSPSAISAQICVALNKGCPRRPDASGVAAHSTKLLDAACTRSDQRSHGKLGQIGAAVVSQLKQARLLRLQTGPSPGPIVIKLSASVHTQGTSQVNRKIVARSALGAHCYNRGKHIGQHHQSSCTDGHCAASAFRLSSVSMMLLPRKSIVAR